MSCRAQPRDLPCRYTSRTAALRSAHNKFDHFYSPLTHLPFKQKPLATCLHPTKPHPHARSSRPSPTHCFRSGVDLGANCLHTASNYIPTSIQPHPTTPHPHALHYRPSPPLYFRSGVDLGANCLQTASSLLPTTVQGYPAFLLSPYGVPSDSLPELDLYRSSTTCQPHVYHTYTTLALNSRLFKRPSKSHPFQICHQSIHIAICCVVEIFHNLHP